MRSAVLSLFALVAPALVAGMAFTDPTANATITKGQYYDLTWSTVDTDPDTFSIYLVNFVYWPPFYTALELDVETASGATSVYVPCDVTDEDGYQFNAINGTNVYVIYAQTPEFTIGGADCTDPTTSAASSTCPAATVTVTVSTTLSSSSYGSSSNSTATGTGKVAAVTSSPTLTASTTSSHTTLGASCPDTIGWGASGYSYPVTLTSVPSESGASAATTTAAAGDWSTRGSWGSSNVVYTTIYKDLSEATGSCNC